jgi:7-cyano-7-deazaguanine reductase
MATIESLQGKYEGLDGRLESRPRGEVDPGCLLTFTYDYSGQDAEVVIDTQEFTAGCPWTGLPDFGTLTIAYAPDRECIELKSLKYYLLSYRAVDIVQEHAANQILADLVAACGPLRMTVTLDYNVRGGLHTTVTARHHKV